MKKLTIQNKYVLALILFLILNSLKLTLFNYTILPSKTFEVFTYKFLVTIPANLLIFSLIFRIRSRLPVIIFYIAQAIYIFSYMSYYAYFGNYLHLFQATSLLTEGVGPIKHFTIPVNLNMLLIFIDLPVLIMHITGYNDNPFIRKGSKAPRAYSGDIPNAQLSKTFKPVSRPGGISSAILPKNTLPAAILGSISLVVLLLIEVCNFADGQSIFQLGRNFYKTEQRIIERYGTFVNNIVDITVNYGGENMINHFKYGKSVTAMAETSHNPNIVIIQVEAMDANIISKKFKDAYITPYLHSLSEQGIYYPYMMSYHKSGGTSDSEFSILNSIEPLGNYPSIKIPKYDYPNSLVKALKNGNYYTMAFHGNIGNYYNRDVAFKKMGFDEFYDIRRMNIPEQGWGVPDHEVFDFALDKMEKQSMPFFSYIITMSSHMPFENTAGYYTNKSYDSLDDKVVRNYYTVMSYVDQSIKDFISRIQARFPDTYILIYGDHTPGIESDFYKQASYAVDGDYFEYVPFIMLTPDSRAYSEKRYAASFLDISPTVLYATGIDFSIKTNGINLAAPAASPSALPEKLPAVPFKEKLYERRELFSKISKESANNN